MLQNQMMVEVPGKPHAKPLGTMSNNTQVKAVKVGWPCGHLKLHAQGRIGPWADLSACVGMLNLCVTVLEVYCACLESDLAGCSC